MFDDIVKASVLNEQFREAYEYALPVNKAVIDCDGCPFVVIGEHKSHWGDISQKWDTGYLYQDATVTIVNPDYTSDTAFLTLFSDKSMECRAGEFRDVENPMIRVVAYPRDTTTPRSPHSDYARKVAEAVPTAYFLSDTTDDYLSATSVWGPHQFFLKQEVKGGQVSDWGLGIQKVTRTTNFRALDTFLDTDILSTRPKVRACFRWLVGALCDPEKLSTPVRSDMALPSARVGRPLLNQG